jgi:TonB family protein
LRRSITLFAWALAVSLAGCATSSGVKPAPTEPVAAAAAPPGESPAPVPAAPPMPAPTPTLAGCEAAARRALFDTVKLLLGDAKVRPGLVTKVALALDDDGNLAAARLLKASGVPRFDAAVLRAITELRSNPLAGEMIAKACGPRQKLVLDVTPPTP